MGSSRGSDGCNDGSGGPEEDATGRDDGYGGAGRSGAQSGEPAGSA